MTETTIERQHALADSLFALDLPEMTVGSAATNDDQGGRLDADG